MSKCQHESFQAQVNVQRLQQIEGGPVTHYCAEIQIKCVDCEALFEFQGLPVGYSAYQPAVDLGGATLNAPIMPPGETPPEGIPGFGVRYVSSDDDGGDHA